MAKAAYDLNVLVDDENPAQTVQKVEQLIRFGYQVVALNRIHTVTAKRKRDGRKATPTADFASITPQKISSMLKNKPENFKILSRITVILDSPDHVRELQSDFVKSFDIVAVRPTNEKLFHQACTQIDLADIISLA